MITSTYLSYPTCREEDSRHYKLAQKTLKEAEDFLVERGWKVTRDNWPFHIIVEPIGGAHISVYCGGYSHYLELMPLTKKGYPNRCYKERSFGGIKSLHNYLYRHWIGSWNKKKGG